MKPKRLSLSDAAKLRGVSREAIYAAIKRKTLRAQFDLGRWVVTEKDLLEWIANQGKRGRRKGQAMTDEHKAKIAAAQKKRWTKRKQQDEK